MNLSFDNLRRRKEFVLLFRGGLTPPGSPHYVPDMQSWGDWMRELAASGNFKEGMPLHVETMLVTGEHGARRGAYGEDGATDVNGCFFVMADSIEEAAELAKGCPLLREGGKVEVRPIMPRDEHDHER